MPRGIGDNHSTTIYTLIAKYPSLEGLVNSKALWTLFGDIIPTQTKTLTDHGVETRESVPKLQELK